MSRFILPLVVLTLVAACGDPPTKENPVPKAVAKPAAAATQTPTATTTKKLDAVVRARSTRPSTVCTRYRAKLALAQTSAAGNGTSAAAKAKLASLRTLVADACE